MPGTPQTLRQRSSQRLRPAIGFLVGSVMSPAFKRTLLWFSRWIGRGRSRLSSLRLAAVLPTSQVAGRLLAMARLTPAIFLEFLGKEVLFHVGTPMLARTTRLLSVKTRCLSPPSGPTL